jgi:hypothetical protein
MRGGAFPPALLCAALGLALAFAPPRARAPSLLILALAGVAASVLPLEERWAEPVLFACWASAILAAASVHLPQGSGFRAAVLLAANTGVSSGAVVGAAGAPLDLLKALPWALLCLPAGWLVARKLGVVVKVLASWLMAVALLAATLPLMPVTAGYEPDHMN